MFVDCDVEVWLPRRCPVTCGDRSIASAAPYDLYALVFASKERSKISLLFVVER